MNVEDAYDTFVNCKIDGLLIPGALISKNEYAQSLENESEALKFAFGADIMFEAQIIVLLHKDRLAEIEGLNEVKSSISGRWSGIITEIHGLAVVFLVTPGGASDVGDCILHLSILNPKVIIYTGTCGSLNPEIVLGQICLVEEASVCDSLQIYSLTPKPFLKQKRIKQNSKSSYQTGQIS